MVSNANPGTFFISIAAPAGSPTNVKIEVLSSTSVVIRWEPPELILSNGIITNYNLIVMFASNSTAQRYAVPATVLSVPIEGSFCILCGNGYS